MDFADELLEQAHHLAHRERKNPRQASLRRSVSTAYYALFHLIVTDGACKWNIVGQQSILFRTIDHKQVRGVCEDNIDFAKRGGPVPPELLQVAKAFVQLIGQRHEADYNNATTWSRTEVIRSLQLATDAFVAWKAIRMSDDAHDFLFQIIMPREPRK